MHSPQQQALFERRILEKARSQAIFHPWLPPAKSLAATPLLASSYPSARREAITARARGSICLCPGTATRIRPRRLNLWITCSGCTIRRCTGLPSAKRHYRITLADAVDAHDRALQYGGLPGILNRSMIESAIQRPYSGYYKSIQRKAAALVHSVATNHGFADGNKRTTLLLLGVLLDRSGYQLVGEGTEPTARAIEDLIVEVADGVHDFNSIHDWMKKWIEVKPG